MSDLIVAPTNIREIRPHPNADTLELAIVKGWQIIVKKGIFQEGDSVIHVPPDSMVLEEYATEWGVWNYLSRKKDAKVGRVKAVRLRQEMSFGFVIPNDQNFPDGEDLKQTFEIEKWEPPELPQEGDAAREHFLFHRYTNIQNIRNFPDLFVAGEPVIMTEKLHGRNSRVGIVKHEETADNEYEFMAGSHNHARKVGSGSIYELGLTDNVRNLLLALKDRVDNLMSAIVFGEIFGPKLQDLAYGQKKPAFRAFDIAVNNEYLDWPDFINMCEEFEVPIVPVLWEGEFSLGVADSLAKGKTTLYSDEPHIREGLVIRPLQERRVLTPGRVVLKSINDDYLLRKGGSEHH